MTDKDIVDDIRLVLSQCEGGFQNNPKDNGNWTRGIAGLGRLVGTNHGISAPVLARWLKLRRPEELTEQQMRAITLDEAAKIGYEYFYKEYRLDVLGWNSAVMVLWDWGWASGPVTSLRLTQQAIGVEADGMLGPITIRTFTDLVQHHGAYDLASRLTKARKDHVKRIVLKNPTQVVFLRGWTRRFDTVLKLSQHADKA